MKVQEFRKKSDKDLTKLLTSLRDDVRDLRFKVFSKEVKNHQLLKIVKKDIAKLLTVLKERQNEPAK